MAVRCRLRLWAERSGEPEHFPLTRPIILVPVSCDSRDFCPPPLAKGRNPFGRAMSDSGNYIKFLAGIGSRIQHIQRHFMYQLSRIFEG